MLDEVIVEKDTSILWLDKSTVILAASLDAGNQALAADHLLRHHTSSRFLSTSEPSTHRFFKP